MRVAFLSLVLLAACPARAEGTAQYVAGQVRVQILSPRLVRIEERGPKGFEDRRTFMVQDRDWPGPGRLVTRKASTGTSLSFGAFRIFVQRDAKRASDVRIEDAKGNLVFRDGFAVVGPISFAPTKTAWSCEAVADSPRVVPPPWGATPVPDNVRTGFAGTSGWDVSGAKTKDIYVFLGDRPSREALIKDYLKLTGKIELPPIWAFGLIDSRYYPYRQAEAIEVIDKYKRLGMPLSAFVLDTDWRKGGSTGYEVETKRWPDIGRFFQDAHARGVRVMLNDHPAPMGRSALDPEELRLRSEGLTSLLMAGADSWWYDRNWIVKLQEPVPGLAPEVWGQRLFHDITQRFRPDRRPMIMANVQGIDNGRTVSPPQPGFHRYPIYWTGDTRSDWKALQDAIGNAVNGGVMNLLPFMSDDLGGHRGRPSPEFYSRFVQYGALSPIMRLHCASGETRFPWAFGQEAEEVARQYVWLRYRLMPTLYAAARRAHDDGTPILRPCDLSWLSDDETGWDQQYLFGDDILVAPVNESRDGQPSGVPVEFFSTRDGAPGIKGEYFENTSMEGVPKATRTDREVRFEWGKGAPCPGLPADGFSVRWTGRIGPMPEAGEYVLGTRADEASRLYLDGKIVVATPSDQDGFAVTKPLTLEAGKSYDIEVQMSDKSGGASVSLVWIRPSQRRKTASRKIWLPPGTWTDLWTGEAIKGPKTVLRDVPLIQTPMFLREGGIVFLGPVERTFNTGTFPELTVDVNVPSAGCTTTRTLYEDDGLSPDYARGVFAKTVVSLQRKGASLKLRVLPARGLFVPGLADRDWLLKFRLPKGTRLVGVKVDGKSVSVLNEPPSNRDYAPGAAVPFFEPWSMKRDLAFVHVPRVTPARGSVIEAALIKLPRAG